jgi:TRAP-type mannitol/chloroaromatic compound transport system substrate-binding protein
MKKTIKKIIQKHLNEQMTSDSLVDFDSFPQDVLKTLKEEYFEYYQGKFDWNEKQDEYGTDRKGFHNFLKRNESESFLKNLDVLITKTRQDLITLLKRKNAEQTLEKFEQLIIPALGDSVLCEPLSEFMEKALFWLHSVKDIEEAFREAENIFDEHGSIDQSKINPSVIFTGDSINYPKFKNFAKKNPDYKGVFKDWEKLFKKTIEDRELNAYRDSTPYSEIRKLYDFLVDFRKNRR